MTMCKHDTSLDSCGLRLGRRRLCTENHDGDHVIREQVGSRDGSWKMDP
jgi:hypothetical protein